MVQEPIEHIPSAVQLLPFFYGERVATAAALTGLLSFQSKITSALLPQPVIRKKGDASSVIAAGGQISAGPSLVLMIDSLFCGSRPNLGDQSLGGDIKPLALCLTHNNSNCKTCCYSVVVKTQSQLPVYQFRSVLCETNLHVVLIAGGNALAAFVSALQSWLVDLGIPSVPSEGEVYTKLLNCASKRTSTTLKMKPTLWGERHAPDQRGQVSLVSPENSSLGDITASLCRGIVENLHEIMPREFLVSCGVQRVVGIGTALERNRVLQKLVEQVLGFPLVMSEGRDASYGAALALLSRSNLVKN